MTATGAPLEVLFSGVHGLLYGTWGELMILPAAQYRLCGQHVSCLLSLASYFLLACAVVKSRMHRYTSMVCSFHLIAAQTTGTQSVSARHPRWLRHQNPSNKIAEIDPPGSESMSDEEYSPSSSDDESTSPLADRLVTACKNGDLPSAKAAVADGASVNEWGRTLGFFSLVRRLPLAEAVYGRHHDMVVWLLSHGADPNGDDVMDGSVDLSTTAILQVLIDAGGDVNQERNGVVGLPLYIAIYCHVEGSLRVLLAQPSLDLTIAFEGNTVTPERFARSELQPKLAAVIAREVRRGRRSVRSLFAR